jgi:hypothetical protein
LGVLEGVTRCDCELKCVNGEVLDFFNSSTALDE